MKKIIQVICGIFIFLSISMYVNAQLVIVPIDDQQAYAGEELEVSVEISKTIDVGNVEFTLLESLDGMSINATTGLITYTPTTINDGGKVVVAVDEVSGPASDTETFYVFVTDAVQCPEGAIGYWKLDEENGAETYDDYVMGNALSRINGVPKDTTGVVDSAKVFDGGNGIKTDDVTLYDWNKSQSFSVEFWMKPSTDADDVEVFIGRNEGDQPTDVHWWVGRNADNQIIFAIRNTSGGVYQAQTSAEPYYPAGGQYAGWHHVVAVRDAEAGQMSLYIDKALKGGGATPIDTNKNVLTSTDPASLDVGYLNNFDQDNYIYDGALDEIILYTKALSQSEINDRYNTSSSGTPACSPGNFAPLFISEPLTEATEDQNYIYIVEAEDVESGELMLAAPVLPAWLSFNATTGELTGTPENENVGDTIVRITVTDGEVEIEQQFTLNIANVNDAPVITSAAVDSIVEDESFQYQLEYNDVDAGDTLTLTATDLPDWLTFSEDGLLTGTPTNDNVGTYSFTLNVEDELGATAELPFELEVHNINDAPVVTGQKPIVIEEDNSITISLDSLLVTDVDDEFPADFSFTLEDGDNYSVAGNVVTPNLNYNGILTVPMIISDGDSTENFDLTITVEPVNDMPVITSTPVLTVDEEDDYLYTITYSDVEDDPIEIIAETLPAWLTLDEATETISGTPDDPEVGDHTVELLVTDGTDTITDAFQITVAPVNDVPTIDDQVERETVYADSVVTISIDDLVITDPDNTTDEMTVIIESGLNYSLSGDDAIIPASGFEGSIAVKVKVSDGEAVSDVHDYVMDVQVFVGINSRKFSNSIISDMYPNPAQNQIFFDLGTQIEKGAKLEIYSITGNLVNVVEIENQARIDVDLTDFSKGVYIFNLINGNVYQTGKFVKN